MPDPSPPDRAAGSGAAELYVYYRVRPGCEARTRQAVCSMHAVLRQQVPTLRVRLLRRCDTSGSLSCETETWMETYACPTGIPPFLIEQIDTHARDWSDCLDGERHMEWFEPCAS